MAGTGRKYQHHPVARKREIVQASLRAGASVALVAREYGVNANQVWAWRKLYSAGGLSEAMPEAARTTIDPVPELLAVDVLVPPDESPTVTFTGRLELVIGAARLSVIGTVDPVMLKTAIAALRA